MWALEQIVNGLNNNRSEPRDKRQQRFRDLLPFINEFVARCEGEPVRIEDNVARLRLLKDLIGCPYSVGLMEFVCEP